MYIICFIGPPTDILRVNFIKKMTSSSLVVQWNGSSDISDTSYVISWIPGGKTILTKMTSYTITGLTVNSTYNITVSYNKSCGDGPEFKTSILFFPDTTSTTNPMTVILSTSTSVNKSYSTTTTGTNTTVIINSPLTTTNITMSPTSITKFSNSVGKFSNIHTYVHT